MRPKHASSVGPMTLLTFCLILHAEKETAHMFFVFIYDEYEKKTPKTFNNIRDYHLAFYVEPQRVDVVNLIRKI